MTTWTDYLESKLENIENGLKSSEATTACDQPRVKKSKVQQFKPVFKLSVFLFEKCSRSHSAKGTKEKCNEVEQYTKFEMKFRTLCQFSNVKVSNDCLFLCEVLTWLLEDIAI